MAPALLVGTVSGVFISWTDGLGKWSRLGSCADLPLVKVAGLTHEHYSDTLVAATMGRGVYALRGARHAVFYAPPEVRRFSPPSPTPDDPRI